MLIVPRTTAFLNTVLEQKMCTFPFFYSSLEDEETITLDHPEQDKKKRFLNINECLSFSNLFVA